MREKTVFISYSHDSDEHCSRVLELSERLREDGINTLLDQYVNGTPQQGWTRWMLDQLETADFVLVVCTETYYHRFRGHEVPEEGKGKGKGADWEGALIAAEIYQCRSRTLKFVPIFLGDSVEDWIPEPMRSSSHYAAFTADGYQNLYDFLLDQAGVKPRPVGVLKTRPRREGVALTSGKWTPKAVRLGLKYGLLQEHSGEIHFSDTYIRHLCHAAVNAVEFELGSVMERGWIPVLESATVAATRVPIREDEFCYFVAEASGLPLASYLLKVCDSAGVLVQRDAAYSPAADLKEEFVELVDTAISEGQTTEKQADTLTIRSLNQLIHSRLLLNNPKCCDHAHLLALFVVISWNWNKGVRGAF